MQSLSRRATTLADQKEQPGQRLAGNGGRSGNRTPDQETHAGTPNLN
jgi:hypothetical protein